MSFGCQPTRDDFNVAHPDAERPMRSEIATFFLGKAQRLDDVGCFVFAIVQGKRVRLPRGGVVSKTP